MSIFLLASHFILQIWAADTPVAPMKIDVAVEASQETSADGKKPEKGSGLKKTSKGVEAIPPVPLRDRILNESGLAPHIKDLDHVDRDMLFIRARKLPLEKLTVAYPKLPRKNLEALTKLAKAANY